MTEAKTCPKCGAEVPANGPAGICPKCLMQAGLEESRASAGGSGYEATASSGRFAPVEPQILAPYFPDLEILELLGHGGMGAVYKSRQTKLDRLVALKIIRPESADDPAFAARFQREARTLARLNHPNIVAVYDFGEVAFAGSEDEDAPPRTVYYFLMEYVDGANLRQVIQGGGLEPQQALSIVPAICEALQYAHDEGVVHRDIKPENILLDQRGRVKIADFGLARLASGSERDFTLTDTDQVMGTPRYMAPEQMEGAHDVDHRADIYSLGVVFYEMLTGQTPAGHFDPPSKKVQIDVRIDDVVLRSMAREPERRYQQVSQIKTDVESISLGVADVRPATPPPPPTAAGVDFVEIESDLNGPSVAMIVIGLLTFLGSVFLAIMCLGNDAEKAVFAVPGVFIGLSMFVGGLSMRRLRSRGGAFFGTIAGVIPAGMGWPVAMPVSIWANLVLQRPQVRRAFIERARQRQSTMATSAPSSELKTGQGFTGAAILISLHFVLWAGVFSALLWLVPTCQRLLDDFGMEFPAASLWVVRISYAAIHYGFLIVPMGTMAMAFDFVILLLLGKVGRKVQSLIGVLLALLPLLLGAAVLLALWLPLTKLFGTLS